MCVSRDAIILILCQRSVVPSNLLTFTFLGPLVSDLHSREIILDLPFSLIFFFKSVYAKGGACKPVLCLVLTSSFMSLVNSL